ncbi:hypothetical protein GU700_01120 [Methylobacterium sp. NI91]|nr:hypothetical protein [Methylobacterium sp. CLZ]QIJ73321.1 hypothetical protein CLZ_01120 [Methylobacterium sp. CLZ]QIJ78225.1 hypothetical protein GU700_01120 [Methylobacterium sp. NI91]
MGGTRAFDPIDPPAGTAEGHGHAADLIINLAAEAPLSPGARVLTPLFNGWPGEAGLMASILEGEDLCIEIHDTDAPEHPWVARPASTDRQLVAATVDAALSCTMPLILRATGCGAAGQRGAQVARSPPSTPPVAGRRALSRAMSVAAGKAVKLIGILAAGGPTWSVGWRKDPSLTLLERFSAPFSILQGSSKSFLADPFPFRHRGRDYIFAEEFPYATGRGVISVIPFGSNGLPEAPRVVLEEPHHLSYPFVFAHDGQIWMIPESGDAQTVCLYRAIDFPDQWERAAVLSTGIKAFDTTVLHHEGRFWFFAGLRMWNSTSWDMLGLYHADSLTGPWKPHADHPVLFDAGLSRPAGAVYEHNGMRLRPAQNCTHGYGEAINICRIDTLSETEFTQTPVGQIHCRPYWCHTYNRHGDLECIDVFGPRRLSQVEAIYETRPEFLQDRPAGDRSRRRSAQRFTVRPRGFYPDAPRR